ncbi:glycogen debranching enzyme [Salana multivorans]|uniref:Glycogen debranching enzyme n=1 Tax=Salana multivorans TaxID=120377 RepID=A0A3N2D126_9MICO|nr:glycogen debranching N-terminal domain-containing protein [Salana multivorans]ROR93358.1 glycogen debranching enzyme [Salana multivorans]
MSLQPFLHDLRPVAAAPTQVWTATDGQLRASGAQGVYHGDVRMLSRLELTIAGGEPEPVAAGPVPGRPRSAEAVYAARAVDGPGPDPTALLRRTLTVSPGRVEVELELLCSTAEPVTGTVELALATDFATLEEVKQGLPTTPARFGVDDSPVGSRLTAGTPEGPRVVVDAPEASARLDPDGGAHLAWTLTAATGAPARVRVAIETANPGGVVRAPVSADVEWSVPVVTADDPRIPRLLERSLGDLAGLRLSWERAPQDVFLAAGAPWFFTLFGRDSLWAARLLLPLGTDLARGTLRTLAAGQGVVDDPRTAEQPGKILHEVRAVPLALADGTTLPPLYYGTVDATALWICLLHDAWRWGMAEEDVAALLDPLERALAWLSDHGDGDGDGFLDYIDRTGTGLANQGWKDSGDSVQWRDGRLAQGPIALSEVQAYAYEAAMGGAELLERFGRPGAQRWRTWAADLAARFRDRFWTTDADGPYVGIALDRDGRLVDSVTSNMGHLLGTGLLSRDEEAVLADRLVAPDMSSGYGLRTLSDDMAGYWPLGYHRGSVWPHDTAIAILGLTRAGLHGHAAVLADGLLAAAELVDFQFPELFGGDPAAATPGVVAYPAACHPQAWSAASAVTVLQSRLGLSVGTDGAPTVAPSATRGAVSVSGVVCGGRTWRVERDADGGVRVTDEAVAAP